jgi:glutamate/tyrosine decarboxylase-like PLP-dependent enzyme
MDLARMFADWVARSDDFELAAPQVLPILNLRLKAGGSSRLDLQALHAAVIEEVNRDGRQWISGAMVNGQSVIRTMVISYLTEDRHLRDLQAALDASSRAVRTSLRQEDRPFIETAPPQQCGEISSSMSGGPGFGRGFPVLLQANNAK